MDIQVETMYMQFADSKIPDFKKVIGKKYIQFGDNNNYPSYLIELYNKSAKHAAIINGKVTYILGNGFKSSTPEGDLFLSKANPNQSWDELSQMICLDLENFGGFYLQVIPKLSGGYNYHHVSFDKIRTNEKNTSFFYKEKWENGWQEADKVYPAFSNGTKETSIFFYKEYHCGKAPYSLPSWVAACNWIESDIEVSKATLTNAKTGFSASKFINFYNGEPKEGQKRSIEKRLENAATGAEGKKLLIGFNNDPLKKPTIDDLGSSDLTKEDFSKVDNLITNNIFAGHNITHPLLFGIQQEGKLGSATELRVAYEIFKNTYITAKQRKIEGVVTLFAKFAGVNSEFKLKDVEPVGLQIPDSILEKVLPVDFVLEKLGIDPSKYSPTPSQTLSTDVNSVMTNLSGRQMQQVNRIVRQFTKGQLNKAQAALMLKNGFGFTDQDVNDYLGLDEDPLTQDQKFSFDDMEIALAFEEHGEEREGYSLIKSENFLGEDDEFEMALQFASELNENEKLITKIISENPKITNVEIAKQIGVKQEVVDLITKGLAEQGILAEKSGSLVRKIIPKDVKIVLPKIKVMYSYEKRPEVSGPELLPTSRPFCRKMVGLSTTKFFSREDIQKISERLGYSVFKRAGGFWNNNGVIDYQCRHGWMKNIVIKK